MPLLSISEQLREDSSEYTYRWFGERNSLEEELAEKYDIPFTHIAAGKLRRYFDWRNFFEPLKNLTGITQALIGLSRPRADIIISK